MSIILRASLIGAVAGLRTVTAPAAISWAAWSGTLPLRGTRLFFLGKTVSPFVFTALAIGELVTDKRPNTPSRLVPYQLGARLVSGALCGAAIGAARGKPVRGLVAGATGAAAGALAGSALRSTSSRAIGSDWPGALLEDAIATAGAVLIARGSAPAPRWAVVRSTPPA